MTDFSRQQSIWESNQWSDYERRMYDADFEEWLEEMSSEERTDYERRKEEREGF